ncbi:hypothetical protein CYMTET_51186 [Cymbomonas tetramitiformis]|uniref:Uncharacterized protein n=1 Tax=Cymbomonas tetramitiformis TaxID=36881 RepID=A0AAE0BLR2_9CHLO|nr:hypothetical protein CYMTET_51186 [Cymbomonas tetramitiformis]
MGPTLVAVNLEASSIREVDQRVGTYFMDAYFRVRWNDPALAWDELEWNGTFEKPSFVKFPPDGDLHQVWLPDLYFVDSLTIDPGSGEYMVEEYLRVYPNGDTLWVRRLAMRNKCSYDFSRLPFDTQNCSLTVESFGETTKEMLIGFSDPAVEGFEDLDSGEWQDFKTFTEVGEVEFSTGMFPYAKITFSMSRHADIYVNEAVVTSILFVVISYCGYFIDPAAAPARVALAVICVLISSASMNSIRAGLPRITYSVWLSDWLAGCMYFNLLAVFSYTVVNFSMQVLKGEAEKKAKNEAAAKELYSPHEGFHGATDPRVFVSADGSENSTPPQSLNAGAVLKNGWSAFKDKLVAFVPYMRKMDEELRWIFPIAFLIYALVMYSKIDSYYRD